MYFPTSLLVRLSVCLCVFIQQATFVETRAANWRFLLQPLLLLLTLVFSLLQNLHSLLILDLPPISYFHLILMLSMNERSKMLVYGGIIMEILIIAMMIIDNQQLFFLLFERRERAKETEKKRESLET